MKDKYSVEYKGNTKSFKTKQDIMNTFNVPLYMVDKIIKKTNDPEFVIKCKCHGVYNDFFSAVDIYLNKPDLGEIF